MIESQELVIIKCDTCNKKLMAEDMGAILAFELEEIASIAAMRCGWMYLGSRRIACPECMDGVSNG